MALLLVFRVHSIGVTRKLCSKLFAVLSRRGIRFVLSAAGNTFSQLHYITNAALGLPLRLILEETPLRIPSSHLKRKFSLPLED
jgi:hypothetical protein